jgi:hypothetical protein
MYRKKERGLTVGKVIKVFVFYLVFAAALIALLTLTRHPIESDMFKSETYVISNESAYMALKLVEEEGTVTGTSTVYGMESKDAVEKKVTTVVGKKNKDGSVRLMMDDLPYILVGKVSEGKLLITVEGEETDPTILTGVSEKTLGQQVDKFIGKMKIKAG